jgi:serine/threonine protein kinase
LVGRWEVAVEGTPFGRYRLVELLGRGGMGEVWRAYDTGTHRVVALKVLAAHLHDDVIYQERFRREARAAAGLDEPHVVPIHDFGEIDGRLYVTMRLLKGDDLQELIAGGPLEPARAVWIVEQIASALHAAHTIGLVHRDIKPSNIVVAEDDFAYLIDFGIAQAEGDSRLTHTGTTIGTWAYMAPERFASGSADARADIYALACVLHEALTGQLPFPNASNAELIVAHLRHPPPRPSAVRPGIPTAMDGVIAVGMAKEPGSRYATTKDLARAAKAALAVPPPARERLHTPAPPTARAAFRTPLPGPERPLTPAPDAPTERAVRDTPPPAPRRPQTPTPQRPQTPVPQPMRPPTFGLHFNPPPNWPGVPRGWVPPPDWQPHPSWPKPPSDWSLWLDPSDVAAPHPGEELMFDTDHVYRWFVRKRSKSLAEAVAGRLSITNHRLLFFSTGATRDQATPVKDKWSALGNYGSLELPLTQLVSVEKQGLSGTLSITFGWPDGAVYGAAFSPEKGGLPKHAARIKTLIAENSRSTCTSPGCWGSTRIR